MLKVFARFTLFVIVIQIIAYYMAGLIAQMFLGKGTADQANTSQLPEVAPEESELANGWFLS